MQVAVVSRLVNWGSRKVLVSFSSNLKYSPNLTVKGGSDSFGVDMNFLKLIGLEVYYHHFGEMMLNGSLNFSTTF